jgi:hypothetical protein
VDKLNQMGKTSFKSLEQISSYISEKINQLNNGQLNTSEIEDLTVNAQELYERLIVIRHKSYETFGESNSTVVEEKPEVIQEVIEKPIQISEEPEQSVEEILGEISPMMSFDFSEPISETKSEVINPIIETVVEEEDIESELMNSASSEPKIENSSSLNDSMSNNTSSLNDSYKSSGSLADRLTNSKISDLKSAIGINEKFAFITELFGGSNEIYNESIHNLNSCNDATEAQNILNELSNSNNWNLDSKTVASFIELLDRRY